MSSGIQWRPGKSEPIEAMDPQIKSALFRVLMYGIRMYPRVSAGTEVVGTADTEAVNTAGPGAVSTAGTVTGLAPATPAAASLLGGQKSGRQPWSEAAAGLPGRLPCLSQLNYARGRPQSSVDERCVSKRVLTRRRPSLALFLSTPVCDHIANRAVDGTSTRVVEVETSPTRDPNVEGPGGTGAGEAGPAETEPQTGRQSLLDATEEGTIASSHGSRPTRLQQT